MLDRRRWTTDGEVILDDRVPGRSTIEPPLSGGKAQTGRQVHEARTIQIKL
ncbi:MAG TPA: hypothetical protein VKN18_24660 [Blastocatellia bacterium]|nr:hypothetical protein [Blastocatellia bacterium]